MGKPPPSRFIERIAAVRRNPWLGAAIALVSVAVAALVRAALTAHLNDGLPFLSFYPAVVVATLFGGLGSGVLALALAAAAADFLFIPPLYSWAAGAKGAYSLLAFGLLGGFNVAVVAALNTALDRELEHERGLRQAQDRQQLLVDELRHRAQNLITVIQTIAQRSLQKADPAEKQQFMQRLVALGRAQSLLADAAWRGAPLSEIMQREFAAFSDRITATGCDVVLNSSAAQQFALIVHELATNALKHGSLSVAAGRVAVEGRVERMDGADIFHFAWHECDGPAVREPARKGFGSTILLETARGIARSVAMTFTPAGLSYELTAPLGVITAAADLEAAAAAA